MPSEQISVPAWTIKLFTIVQPVVVAAAGWVIVEMRGLRDQVTVLNVQMSHVIQTDNKLENLSERFNILSSRVARMEGARDAREGPE